MLTPVGVVMTSAEVLFVPLPDTLPSAAAMGYSRKIADIHVFILIHLNPILSVSLMKKRPETVLKQRKILLSGRVR